MTLQPKVMGNFRQTTKKFKSRAYREDPGHLKFVRSLPSCLSGQRGCVAHHLLSIPGSRGTSLKAEDWWTLPLTWEEHERLHHIDNVTSATEEVWFVTQGVAPHILARTLWHNSGDHEVCEYWIQLAIRREHE
jgi:hypothetical protein